ncbi:RHS repeat-associated core domain-containing protein, partial [candidate division KSB1 bacterium]
MKYLYIIAICLFITSVYGQQNPTPVNPPTAGVFGGPDPINDVGVVGNLEGAYSVSPSGAMIYKIPIEIPEGRNGMQPEIGFVYNSQAGNGLLGLGWGLYGFSSITRTGENWYHEGMINGMDFEMDDKFLLDGERLIAISGNYGDDGTEYRTENESYAKIISKGTGVNSPDWFIVYLNNGLIYEYGNTPDSRVEAEGKLEVLKWNLNKISDRKGNYLKFEYYEISSNGETYPKYIEYTGNDLLSRPCYYRIIFNYDPGRPDISRYYVHGSLISTMERLQSVQVYHIPSHTYVGEYELVYTEDSEAPYFSYLNKITQKGKGFTKKFNPLEMEYQGGGSANFSNANYWTGDFTQVQNYNNIKEDPRIMADVNGDGLDDIIGFYKSGISVALSTGSGFGPSANWFNDATYFPLWDYTWEWNLFDPADPYNLLYTRIAGDVNGDGLADVVGFHKDRTYVYISNGNGFTLTSSIANFCTSEGWTNTGDYPRFLADVNGDGRDDIIGFGYDAVGVALSYGTGFHDASIWINAAWSGSAGWNERHSTNEYKYFRTMADINGDGMADIVGFPFSGVHYSFSTGSSFTYPNITYTDFAQGNGWLSTECPRYLSDVNGDRMADIVGFGDDGVYVGLSNGDGFEAAAMWSDYYGNNYNWNLDIANGNPMFHRTLSDVNGDGMADIVGFYYDNVIVSISNGLEFGFGTNNINSWNSFYGFNDQWIDHITHPRLLGDINGDGSSDIIGFWDNEVVYSYSNKRIPKIGKTINSMNLEVEFSYLPITNSLGSVYSKYSNSTYPVMDFQKPLWVLREIISPSENHIYFTYEGAKVHLQGKGFTGFAKMINENINGNTNILTESENLFNSTFFYYSPSLTTVSINSNLASTTEYLEKVYNLGNKRIFRSIYTIFTEDYDPRNGSNPIRATKTLLDNYFYGKLTDKYVYIDENPLSSHSVNDAVSTYPYYTKTTNTYEQNINDWLFRIKTSEIKKKVPNDIEDKVFFNYDYYPNSDSRFPLLKKSTKTPNNNSILTIISEYDFDGFGNIIEETVSAPNASPQINSRTVSYEYSLLYHGRFPTKKTILNQGGVNLIEEYDYDEAMGLTRLFTDPNGLITTYTYDDFGRLTETLHPDGTETKVVLRWTSNQSLPDAPGDADYYSWAATSGDAETVVFYDQKRRDIRNVSIGYNGIKIYQDKVYDVFNYNRIEIETEPYFSNQSQNKISIYYNYDSYNSLRYKVHPAATVEFDNNGLTTTETNISASPIQSQSKTYNVIGKVESVTDAAGTINYQYYSDGNIKQIDAFGNTTTFSYDDAGRMSQLIDPDAGSMFYVYNAFGELTEQTDANGNSFEMTYDNIGRLYTKTDNTGQNITTYTYDGPNGIGSLLSVTSSSPAYTKFYTYSPHCRIESIREDFFGRSYLSEYTYTVDGDLDIYTYPSGYEIEYHYDSYGYLYEIFDPSLSNPIWTLNDLNAKGQITEYLLNTNIEVEKTYSSYGHLEHIASKELVNNTSIQSLGYTYDYSTGNLTSRTDYNYYKSEFFVNDHLNRLTHATVNSGPYAINMIYANDGNINNKSDVGQYEYNGIQPHAITDITNPLASFIPNEANQIIDYTSFNKVSSIQHINEGKQLEIEYGAEEQRIRSLYSENSVLIEEKHFVHGNFENVIDPVTSNERWLHYIITPDGINAIVEINTGGGSTPVVYYVLLDHLGSFYKITDEYGNVINYNNTDQFFNFDAWGNRRDPITWEMLTSSDQYLTDRGFTCHEHLDALELINMNGRVYDPQLGRFLSPDNYVQAPEFSQNFNRYSYCANNPLVYTDPDGEWIHLAIGAIIGGVINWAANGSEFSLQGLGYFGVGTLAGAISAGISSGFMAVSSGASFSSGFIGTQSAINAISIGYSSSFLSGVQIGGVSGFSIGFITGTGNALIQGQNLGESLWSGTKSGMASAMTGALFGGIFGGINAVSNGNNFWDGYYHLKDADNEYLQLLASTDKSVGSVPSPGIGDWNWSKAKKTAHFYKWIRYENKYGDGIIDINQAFSNYNKYD